MPKRFVDDYLLFQMAILSHNFSADFYRYLKTKRIKPAKWRILLNLSELSGMYITQLAEHSCYEQSRVTKLVDQLCDEGLVSREISSQDRRRVKVSITKQGEELLRPLIKAAEEHEHRVLEELPKRDQVKLKGILNTFMQNHVDAIVDPDK